jgi:hypothetical protein
LSGRGEETRKRHCVASFGDLKESQAAGQEVLIVMIKRLSTIADIMRRCIIMVLDIGKMNNYPVSFAAMQRQLKAKGRHMLRSP